MTKWASKHHKLTGGWFIMYGHLLCVNFFFFFLEKFYGKAYYTLLHIRSWVFNFVNESLKCMKPF